jgi:hypothetical protein
MFHLALAPMQRKACGVVLVTLCREAKACERIFLALSLGPGRAVA